MWNTNRGQPPIAADLDEIAVLHKAEKLKFLQQIFLIAWCGLVSICSNILTSLLNHPGEDSSNDNFGNLRRNPK